MLLLLCLLNQSRQRRGALLSTCRKPIWSVKGSILLFYEGITPDFNKLFFCFSFIKQTYQQPAMVASTATLSSSALSLVGAQTRARLESKEDVIVEPLLIEAPLIDQKSEGEEIQIQDGEKPSSVFLEAIIPLPAPVMTTEMPTPIKPDEIDKPTVDVGMRNEEVLSEFVETSEVLPEKNLEDSQSIDFDFNVIATPDTVEAGMADKDIRSVSFDMGEPVELTHGDAPVVHFSEDNGAKQIVIKITLDDEDDSSVPGVEEKSTFDLKSNVLSSVLKSVSEEAPPPPSTSPNKGKGNKKIVVHKTKSVAAKKPSARRSVEGTKQMQALQLDLPDKRAESRQKQAMLVAKTLEGALEKLKEDAQKDLLGQLESESSLITSYFDRSAKPMFVDRGGKNEKHRLVARRQSLGDVSVRSGKMSDLDTDSITSDVVRREVEAKTGVKISIPHSSHDRQERVDNFVSQILSKMTEEERKQFEQLDEKTREKILHDLKHQQQVSGEAITPSVLKAMTEKATEENKVLSLQRMDLLLEVASCTDRVLTVSLSSQVGGPCKLFIVFPCIIRLLLIIIFFLQYMWCLSRPILVFKLAIYRAFSNLSTQSAPYKV